jgi:hypothetical protein
MITMLDQDVLSPDDERLLRLAIAIADGTPIDWSAVARPVTSSSLSAGHSDWPAFVDRLQHLERLVRGTRGSSVRTRPFRS